MKNKRFAMGKHSHVDVLITLEDSGPFWSFGMLFLLDFYSGKQKSLYAHQALVFLPSRFILQGYELKRFLANSFIFTVSSRQIFGLSENFLFML